MSDYLNLPIGDLAPEAATAVIEIPQGSTSKYEYDKKLKVFRLDRNLYSPVHYPGDYGFIPRTLAEDGGPLDMLVLGDAPTFRGAFTPPAPSVFSRCWTRVFETRKSLRMQREIPVSAAFRITRMFSHISCGKWRIFFNLQGSRR